MAVKRRRLGDLFVRGAELAVSDGEGDPVMVWIAKLNEIDREAVYRRAQAAKAKFMIDCDNETSEAFMSMYSTVRDFENRDSLVKIINADDLRRFRLRTEAQLVADEQTWGKDNYLQGLTDAWIGDDDNGGLARIAAEDPDDPEAQRVKAELDRFDAEVNQQVERETQRLDELWADVTDDELWRRATHQVLKRRGEDVFVREAERQQIFHAVRESDDHRKRYFSTVAEVDDLEDGVRSQLTAKINALAIDVTEGKDLPATQGSSPSPESPGEATPVPSGLAVVSA